MEYCTHNPGICLNGGTCVSSMPDIFCLCPANYEGEHCEKLKIINSCLLSPCLHSGTCVRMPNSSKYTCTCSARYTGGHCETEIPTNPCSADDFQCLCSLNVTFCKYTTKVVTPLTVDRLSNITTKTTATISAVNPTTPSNATSTSPTTVSRNQTTTVNSTDDENNKLPRPPISDELRSILVISSVAIVSLILIVTTLVIACCCRRRRQQRRQQSKILNNFGANNQTISSRSTSSSFNNKTKNCQVVIKNDITNSRRNINLSTENEVLDKLTNKHQNIKNERRCNECLAQAIQVEKKAKEISKHRLWKPSLDLNYTYQCSSCGLVDLTPNSIYENSTAMKDLQTEADHPTKAKSVLVTIEPQLRSPKRKDATSIAKLSVLESSSGDFNYTSSISCDRGIMTADEDNIFNEYNDDRIRATCV
ncbi:hypothetical protein HELRODRAFT_189468 [Helobdella robusta]|uniref:EGF-like domain-containing protein n=1 Tax=Helobdella robusta TaxID=6412 RepID=T1FR30_HELRO|nr:hypothetical protein HELRODRAFT_189468 [Helobdella robusta]ESN94660.1 hypothetical protein HELRODRAFT_189468 [Helobdella robusta]